MARFWVVLLLAGCSRTETPASGVRVVSCAPSLTECLFAIGAGEQLAGRTDVCDYPPEAEKIPVTGKFAQPFLEATLAVNPTVVLETAWADADLRRRFEQAGIPVVHVPCLHVKDVPAALRQLGLLTGHTQQAEKEARELEQALDTAFARANAPGQKPRVLILVDASEPITVGPQTFISEMISLAGGQNIAEGATADYYHLSLEWILTHEPDCILCLFHAPDPHPRGWTGFFSARPGWKDLRAVQNGAVCTVGDLDPVCRPGPRLLLGLKELQNAIPSKTHSCRF